jgi:hypothetical protein
MATVRFCSPDSGYTEEEYGPKDALIDNMYNELMTKTELLAEVYIAKYSLASLASCQNSCCCIPQMYACLNTLMLCVLGSTL